MKAPSDKPIYFLPADHPDVLSWNTFLDSFSKDHDSILFPIDPELVEGRDVAGIQQFMFAVQHRPQLIEKLVFALDFKFRQVADGDLYYQEMDWKSDAKYYSWFFNMSTQPHLLFFIRDHDARFYFLMGDLLAANKVSAKETKPGKRHAIKFNGDQLQLMANRFFNSCRLFNLYCHGSGFKPQPYIESLIAEYSFEETGMNQMLFEQYYEDITKGVQLFIPPQKK